MVVDASFVSKLNLKSPLFWILTVLLFFTFVCVIEAVLLSVFGAALGKWLFNINLRNNSDEKLSFIMALKRTIDVYVRGNWFVIPLLDIIPRLWSYKYLIRNNITPWDKKYNIFVTYKDIGMVKKIIGIALIGLIMLSFVLPKVIG